MEVPAVCPDHGDAALSEDMCCRTCDHVLRAGAGQGVPEVPERAGAVPATAPTRLSVPSLSAPSTPSVPDAATGERLVGISAAAVGALVLLVVFLGLALNAHRQHDRAPERPSSPSVSETGPSRAAVVAHEVSR